MISWTSRSVTRDARSSSTSSRLWRGETVSHDGELLRVEGAQLSRRPDPVPPLYFGGSSPEAGPVAARYSDVYLTWGEPPAAVDAKLRWMDGLAREAGRTLRYGIRLHVITRDTSHEAWRQANRLIEGVDEAMIARCSTSWPRSESEGQRRMRDLHGGSTANLEMSPNLWAGVGLLRGGAGTALVGSHTEVADRIEEYAALGLSEFILSGYPHLEEAYWFGEGVLPILRASAAAGGIPCPTARTTARGTTPSRPRRSRPAGRRIVIGPFPRTGRLPATLPHLSTTEVDVMRIAVVTGNPKPASRTHGVALAVAGALAAALAAGSRQAPHLVVDLTEHASSLFDPSAAELTRLTAEVAEADVAVFASPTYKAAYTGLLKAFLDRYGNNGLAGTIAVPVMTGGWAGHALAVEVHLRPVLVELGATVPARGLYVTEPELPELDAAVARWAAAAIPLIRRALAVHEAGRV